MPRWRIPRPRFSLLTLLLGVLFAGACFGLWWRWEPWVCEMTIVVPDVQDISVEAWSRDRKMLCTLSERKDSDGNIQSVRVCLWSTDSGQLLADEEFRPSSPAPSWGFARFSDGGRWLVWSGITPSGEGSGPPQSRIWDLRGLVEGKAFRPMAFPPVNRILEISPDDRLWIVSSPVCTSVVEWDSTCEPFLLQQRPCHQADFSPDGKRLVLIGDQILLWDMQTRQLRQTIPGDRAMFSPDGRHLLVPDPTREKTTVYSTADGTPRLVLEGTLPVIGRFFDHGGTRVVMEQKDFWVVYEMESGREVSRICKGGSFGAWLSEDGQRLVEAKLWDVDAGKELIGTGLRGYPSSVGNFWGSMAGRRMSHEAYSGGHFVLIADMEDGRELFEIPLSGPSTSWFRSEEQLAICSGASVRFFFRRRPEYWWGIAWLPEFWVAYVAGGALLVIAARNLRRRFARKTDGLASTH